MKTSFIIFQIYMEFRIHILEIFFTVFPHKFFNFFQIKKKIHEQYNFLSYIQEIFSNMKN